MRAGGASDLPPGYVVSVEGRTWLAVERGLESEVREAGLGRSDGWEKHLRSPARGPGRGATAVIRLPSGRLARLKRLRRGGWAARLWKDRFAGRRRLVDNLRIPVEAARRGLPTPSVLALLVQQSGPGLFRAWLALEELENTVDLARVFASERPPSRAEIGAALGVVRRMHELGLEHRDLNLGNLLIRREVDPTAFVVDLDGARLHPSPIAFSLRQRALRRLERSYAKSCGSAAPSAAPSEEVRGSLYSLYAGEDRTLAERLQKGRAAGRLWILLHRLGW